jgi:N-acetylmuramoyl-L-alanine amidase
LQARKLLTLLGSDVMLSVLCTALLTCLVGLCEGCRAPEPRREGPAPEVDPMAAVSTLIPAPEDFAARHVGSEEYPIPPYAKFLEGVKICLDPGHGGDAHKRGYKRGGTGVREAEVNLRVAKYLREFLVTAGAEVLLTRAADVDVSLAERAAIANEWDADLFISLHHNAIGNKPHVNYTTVCMTRSRWSRSPTCRSRAISSCTSRASPSYATPTSPPP